VSAFERERRLASGQEWAMELQSILADIDKLSFQLNAAFVRFNQHLDRCPPGAAAPPYLPSAA